MSHHFQVSKESCQRRKWLMGLWKLRSATVRRLQARTSFPRTCPHCSTYSLCSLAEDTWHLGRAPGSNSPGRSTIITRELGGCSGLLWACQGQDRSAPSSWHHGAGIWFPYGCRRRALRLVPASRGCRAGQQWYCLCSVVP